MNDRQIIDKKSTKILPIQHPSPVIVYLGYALCLSIILSNKKNYDWYMSNFIHYYINLKEENIFDFYFPNVIEWQNSLPLRVYKFHDKLLSIDKVNIIESVIQWIDNGYYIRLEINEKNISGTQIDFDLIHPVFIYGYDMDNKKFLSLNFDEERTYRSMDISFNEIREAFYSKTTSSLISDTFYTNVAEDADKYLITLYKLRDLFYTFDIQKLINDIELYINGVNVSSLYPCLRIPVEDCSFWGINIYKGLNQYLKSINDKCDYRIFHGIWEQKKIMTARISYLVEKELLNCDSKFLLKFSEIEKMTDILRMYIIKYNFSRKKDLINKSLNLINELYSKEKSLLETLLKNFKT